MSDTSQRTDSRAAKNGTRSWRTFGVAGGLIGIALLLLLSPMAQANSAGSASVSVKAPFVGATGYGSTSVSASGCGAGKLVHQPFFDASTGGAGFSLRGHATPCSPSFGDSGTASASETVTVPFAVPSGATVVHAKWTLSAALGTRVGSASCALFNASYSYCYSESYAQISAYAYLYDATNGTYQYSNSYWDGAAASSSFYAACYVGNCSSSFSGNEHTSVASNVIWSFRDHGLNSSHAYELIVSWYADVSVYDFTYLASLSGASETGWVTMAGPGFGATLDSINIR